MGYFNIDMVMKIQELRVGNWYNKDGQNWQFTEQDFSTVYYSIEDISPIPLTKEWLLKFGFTFSESFKDHFYKIIYEQSLIKVFPFRQGETICMVDSGHAIECKYVHQLQNLYYALTGEELTT